MAGCLEMLKLFKEHITRDWTLADLTLLLKERDSSTGCTLLNFACGQCDYEALQELLQLCRTADYTTTASNGNTCLHSVAVNRNLSLVISPCIDCRKPKPPSPNNYL